jgi:hypothetical protein
MIGPDAEVDHQLSLSFFQILLAYRDWQEMPTKRSKLLDSMKRTIREARERKSKALVAASSSHRGRPRPKTATRKARAQLREPVRHQTSGDENNSFPHPPVPLLHPDITETASTSPFQDLATGIEAPGGVHQSHICSSMKAWFQPEPRPVSWPSLEKPAPKRINSGPPGSSTITPEDRSQLDRQDCASHSAAINQAVSMTVSETATERPKKRPRNERTTPHRASVSAHGLTPDTGSNVKVEPHSNPEPRLSLGRAPDTIMTAPLSIGHTVVREPKRKLVKAELADERNSFPENVKPLIWAQV